MSAVLPPFFSGRPAGRPRKGFHLRVTSNARRRACELLQSVVLRKPICAGAPSIFRAASSNVWAWPAP